FTVLPWLGEHEAQPIKLGQVISGGRRNENVGDELEPASVPSPVYGKLEKSGVGPLDDSLFAPYEAVATIANGAPGTRYGGIPSFDRSKVSAILVKLAFGATPERIRFALAKLPGIKVVTGAKIVTSTRQTTTALLTAMLFFTSFMLLGTLILTSL